MGRIFIKATDPHQYDNKENGWSLQPTGLDSPLSAMYWEYFSPYAVNWKGKDLLELGCGTGWLLDLALHAGVKSAIGIDPSKINLELSRKCYPHLDVVRSSLEDFYTNKKFDIVLAVMVLVHIADIEVAFKKIASFLKPNGEFQILVPNYDYYKKPRFDYEIFFENVSDNEYAILIKRPGFLELADVVRKVEKYEAVGKRLGFNLVENLSLFPTKQYMHQLPQYKQFEEVVMYHLLRFRKTR